MFCGRVLYIITSHVSSRFHCVVWICPPPPFITVNNENSIIYIAFPLLPSLIVVNTKRTYFNTIYGFARRSNTLWEPYNKQNKINKKRRVLWKPLSHSDNGRRYNASRDPRRIGSRKMNRSHCIVNDLITHYSILHLSRTVRTKHNTFKRTR